MIIITGQTATGKTKLALELAKNIPPPGGGELINFDSRQVYKYLDIITGKDLYLFPQQISTSFNKFQRVSTRIWLYDIVSPDQYFSSFDFVQHVTPIIQDIKKRNKTPILVGGTYLYLKHLLYGFDYKVPPNFLLREKLNNKSVKELQNILTKLDIQSINRLNNSDRNNPRRLIRRIEIVTFLKEAKTPVFEQSPGAPTYVGVRRRKNTVSSFSIIGLRYKNKDKLRQAIKTRVEKRLKNGAINEVKKLLKMGYTENDPGLKTIGYQQILQYLKSKGIARNAPTLEKQMIQNWITAEVQYAKRQYTFMKKDKNISWREI